MSHGVFHRVCSRLSLLEVDRDKQDVLIDERLNQRYERMSTHLHDRQVSYQVMHDV